MAAKLNNTGRHQIVAIETGMNYWDGQQWSSSDPSFQAAPDGSGFVANRVQHPVRIAGNLNTPGAVTITTDGTAIQSTPVAIALYDSASGKRAIIAAITNCSGVMVNSNTVVFENAFDSVCANVVFTLERGAFHQDVVLFGKLDPRNWGFPTNTTRIQIITEFYGAPRPDRMRRPLYVEKNESVRQKMESPDLVDEVLGFGQLVLGTGRAYLAANGSQTNNHAVPVAKEFVTITDQNGAGARTFLFESVVYSAVRAALASLPDCNPRLALRGSGREATRGALATLNIPKPAAGRTANAAPRATPADMARLGPGKRPGLTIDYVATIGGPLDGPVVFQGDVTFFVAGPVYCNGPTVIEGGAVFKYPTSPASIQLNSSFTCAVSDYRPACFTAVDDDGIGESMLDVPGANYTGTINPGVYYANPAVLEAYVGPPLSNLRFSYCAEAIQIYFTDNSTSISDCQIVNCIRGIHVAGGDDGCGCGCGCSIVTVNNTLFGHVDCPLTIDSADDPSGSFWQCTFDGAGALVYSLGDSCAANWGFCNCVLANVGLLVSGCGSPSVGGAYNGFYNSPHFGSPVFDSGTTSPFQALGFGSYYLTDASGFRAKGTTPYPQLIATLKSRTTRPPVSLTAAMDVTGQLTLSPQVARYTSGAADLGYYYPALDYTVASVFVESGGGITVAPGTAIAVRNDHDPTGHWLWCGFILRENSTFVSHGTPTSPSVFTTLRLVQEGPFDLGWNIAFVSDFDGHYFTDAPPLLSFRFSNFSLTAEDVHLAAGCFGPPVPMRFDLDLLFPANSSMRWSLQDCSLRGGGISLTEPYHMWYAFPPGALSWVNNLFDRVWIDLEPCYSPDVVNIDLPLQAYNNLWRGGSLAVLASPTSAGNWTFKDNLFEQVIFIQPDPALLPLPLDHDYNAYWLYPGPFPTGLAARLIPNNNDGGVDALNDVVLPGSPPFLSGPFGDYYLPSVLPSAYPLHDSGSRSPAQAGLYQYTTRIDQVKEGNEPNTPNMVDIGLHYLAAANGAPISSYVAGVPDYVADADGNGVVDALDASTRATQANNDIFQVQQGSAGNALPVLVNDTDSQALPLAVWYPPSSASTQHGTVAPAPDFLSLTYTPSSTFWGADTFTYAIVNDFGSESSARVSVFVNKTGNHPPAAGNYQVTMSASDTFIDIPLANDSDQDGDPLVIYSIATPQLGTAQDVSAPTGQRTIRYSRPVSIAGLDVFTYTITDGQGGRAVGAVQVDRNAGANHAPVAVSYSTSAAPSPPLNLKLIASDQDNDPLTCTILVPVQHGTISGTPPDLTYTPAPGYYGPDYIRFKVSDGALESTPATITIHDQYDNWEPSAEPQSVLAIKDTPAPITLSGLDPDYDYLFFPPADSLLGTLSPSHGTLGGTPPNLTYTPAAGYTGPDSFTFIVNDGKADSYPATIAINVIPPWPLTTAANDDLFEVQQGSTAASPENALDVLANDTDSEGYALTITSPSSATSSPHGTVSPAVDSLSLVYVPEGSFYGADTFTYTVSNGHGRTATGNVTVFVNKTGNSDPVAADDLVTLPLVATTATIDVSGLLANCSDPDGDSLTLYSVGSPAMGTAVNNGVGQIVYTRYPSKYGLDTFNYSVTDGNGGYGTATIAVGQADTDGNGLPDDWEAAYLGFDPTTPNNPVGDPDADGLANLAEYELHTNPTSPDNPLNLGLSTGATLCGSVTIPLALSADLDPSTSVELYVNGSPAENGSVKKTANGSWFCLLDTTSLPNGRYWLQLVYTYPECDFDLLAAHYMPIHLFGAPKLVSISNPLTFDDLTSVFTSTLFIKARANVPADTYTIELYDQNDQHLQTLSGAILSRNVYTTWDLKDGIGNVIVNGPVRAEVSLSNSQGDGRGAGGGSPVSKRIFDNEPESTVDADFVVAYGFNEQPIESQFKIQQGMLECVVNILGNPARDDEYNLLPPVNVPLVSAYEQFDSERSPRILTNAIAQGNNFFFSGHANAFFASAVAVACMYPIRASQVSQLLGFSPSKSGASPKHPYRLVILKGCNTYSKAWANAFGIRPFWGTGRTPFTMADYEAIGLGPRAFVGWTGSVQIPTDPDAWLWWHEGYAELLDHWMGGERLDVCMEWFADAMLGWQGNASYGISGCIDLRRQQRP